MGKKFQDQEKKNTNVQMIRADMILSSELLTLSFLEIKTKPVSCFHQEEEQSKPVDQETWALEQVFSNLCDLETVTEPLCFRALICEMHNHHSLSLFQQEQLEL